MQPISATRPNQILTTDIMGPIPLCNDKFKYILIICDHFTKYCEFFALESTTAQETARRIIEYISRHSVPESILSDRGTNYQSELIAEVYELLDIHQLRTTSYWPQCDGQSERMCQSLQKMLACYVNDKKNDWAEFLPLLQFAYNSSIHSTTKFSPFELTYGRHPRLPLDLLTHSAKLDLYLSMNSYAEQLQTQLAAAYEKVIVNTDMSIAPHKIQHDRKTRAAIFEVDDYVWVLDTAKLKGVSKKLSNRYKGPYKIVTVIDDANYKVKTINGKKTTIVNKARMKRCFPRRFLLELDNDVNNSIFDDGTNLVNTTDASKNNSSNKTLLKSTKTVTFDDSADKRPKKTTKAKDLTLEKHPKAQDPSTKTTKSKKKKKKAKNSTVTQNDNLVQDIDSTIHHPTTTNQEANPDGKRKRKTPDFFQAGVK